MDFIKVQIEALKVWEKIKNGKLTERNLIIGSNEYNTYVIMNATVMVVIPNDKYYLNLPMENKLETIKKAMSIEGKSGYEGVLTGEMIQGKKDTFLKLHTEKFDAYINKKHEKFFPFDSMSFVPTGQIAPVYLYEKGIFVGVIAGVKI